MMYADKIIWGVIFTCCIITEAGFIIPPYITKAAKNPNMQSEILVFLKIPFLKSIPAINPIMPSENICHGVHGPCPKKKFDTKPVTAPVKNPVSPPKHTPVIIITAKTGLNCGSIKNAALPPTAIAHITLIITSSRACGFLLSNAMANGIIVSRIISILIR